MQQQVALECKVREIDLLPDICIQRAVKGEKAEPILRRLVGSVKCVVSLAGVVVVQLDHWQGICRAFVQRVLICLLALPCLALPCQKKRGLGKS